MKFSLLSTIVILTFFGCSNPKETAVQKQEQFNIIIHFDIERRHCGGTPPPKDYVNGKKTESLTEQKFYIKSGNENKDGSSVIQSFTTDENGNATVSLPAGVYCVVIPEKIDDFETFHEKQSKVKDEFTKAESEECFKKWYQKCDGEIKVNSSSEYNFTIKEHCGYDFNPCMRYTGPPQP